MRRFFPIVAVLLMGLISSLCWSQSKDEGLRLFKEAGILKEKAVSKADLEMAVHKYEEALKVFRKAGFQKGEGAVLNNLGAVNDDLGRYAKAAECYARSLEIRRNIGDKKGEAETLNNLGLVFCSLGQYEGAAKCYREALGKAQKLNDVTIEVKALNNLGMLYEAKGDYSKAAQQYETSLEIKTRIADEKGTISSLIGLGVLCKNWGKYGKAVAYYEEAMKIARKLGDMKNEGIILTNLGNVYFDWGQYSKAVECYEESMEIAGKLGDAKIEGKALSNLGNVYQVWGQYDKALESFQQALGIYKMIGAPTNLASYTLGNLYLEMGDLKQAEPFVRKGNYASSLGRLSLLKTDYGAARKHYEGLLRSAEKNRKADNLFAAYTGLGMCYEGTGDHPKAAEYYRKAVEHTEDLRSSLDPNERETFLNAKINGFNRTAPYEGLTRALLKMGKAVEAFRASEYIRARIFAEAISKRRESANQDVPEALRETDSRLADELAALTRNLQNAYENENKEAIASLEPQVKEAKQKLAAHVDMLRKEYPLFAATKYPQPMGLDQTALKDNEWVLTYHVTDPGLIVYLTKGKNLVKAELKPVTRKDIDALVRKFREPLEIKPEDTREQITRKMNSFDLQTGKKLSDILLADVLPSLPRDAKVIVVPDDCLGVLPFEMLPLNDAGKIASDGRAWKTTGAQLFGDRNPISYYQSITALTLARTYGKSRGKAEKILVMDDPIFGPDDPRLKSMAQAKKQQLMDSLPQNLMSIKTELKMGFPRLAYTGELGKSLKSLDPGKTEEHTGMEAAKPILFSKPLDNYGAMVFATHGYFGKDLPGVMEPVLVLTLVDQPKGQDGFLRLSEVMGLKINADLVALTACQTGLGRKISGEGTMGMGRAFQYAGARCVLVSLWSVSEKASVNLVESFFKHMKAGKSKLEALRLARKEIREQGYDHPFYWSPFILVGEVD